MTVDLETLRFDLENKKAIFIDVREKDEWDEGRIKNALFLPLSDLEEHSPDNLDKESILYLYCRRGRRALKAKELLKEKYPKVQAVQYGFDELEEAGFPTEK